MAHLLYKWINEEVVLSKKVTNFAKDFSNGYLFADLLHVYNQLNDFPEYVNKSASNAKITNFCRLEPVFRRLGLRFDSKIAFEIIKEYPRTAMNLVASLKNVLDKISSKASAVVGRPRRDGVRRLTNMPLRLTRETYDKAQHELFEKSIRMYIKGQNQVDMAKHLKKFTDFQQNLEETAYQEGIAALQAFFAEKDMIRQQRRQNLQREHEFLHDWQEKGIEEWAYNQQIQKEREDHTRRMKRREKDAKKAREIKARLDSNAEAVGGLEKFEQTLLGAELLKAKKAVQPEELSMSMKSRKPEPYSYEVTSKMNQDEFFNATKRLTGNPKRWKIQYTKAINMVKESAERKARLREQRERRRRKFLADSQLSRASRASNIEKQQLCEKIVGKTAMERELLDDLDKINLHTKIFAKNRENRELMYKERRELDEEEAILRDNEYYMVQRAAYEEEIAQQKERVKTYDKARSLSQKRATINFCQETVDKILDLTFRTLDLRRTREHNGVALGMEQELKHVFTQNTTDMKADGCECGDVPPSVANEEMIAYIDNTLSFWGTSNNISDVVEEDVETKEADASAAVEGEEPGEGAAVGAGDDNAQDGVSAELLNGKVIQKLRKIVADAAPKPELDLPPKMPLTACIVGGPFSGKSSQAKRLADKYTLAVIDVDALIEESIKWSKKSADAEVMLLEGTLEASVDDRAYHNTMSAIGKTIKESMINGRMVEDQNYVDLVIAKIRLVAAQANTIASEAIATDTGITREEFGNDEAKYREAMLKFLFDTWDEDGSGTLDIAEMVKAVRSFGEGLSEDQLAEEALEIVHQMDEDHDNQISFDEAGTYFTALFSTHTNEMFDTTLNTILATTRQKPFRGWVLDGFPRTLQQAKLLERALTGYDDTVAGGTQGIVFSKKIAPEPPVPPKDPSHLYGKSGIDMVLNIDAKMDTLFRRALGRRQDPLNDTVQYHVEFNPPSSENPIKMRLTDTDDMSKWRATLAPTFSAYMEQLPQLKRWYESFNILHNIDPFLPKGGGQLGPDALFSRLSEPIEIFLNEKHKIDMEKKAQLTKMLRRRSAGSLYDVICEIKRSTVSADSTFTNKDLVQILKALHAEMMQRYNGIVDAQNSDNDVEIKRITNLHNDTPLLKTKVFGLLTERFSTCLKESKLLEVESTARDFDEIAKTEFTDKIMMVCGEDKIVASPFSHLLSCIKRVAKDIYGSKNYAVGLIYETWGKGPQELSHVTCTCDTDSMQTVLRAYNQQTRALMEEREALLQQEKEALDEADSEDEDAVEISDKPALPKLFNLGQMEEAEEDPKGKKGKKGKTPEPSVESTPVGQEDFVSQVLGYINSPSTAEEDLDDMAEVTDDILNATLKKLVSVIDETIIVPARDNAPDAPVTEPPPPPTYKELPTVDFGDNDAAIDDQSAALLLNYWDTTVEAYTSQLMCSMAFLSKQRSEVLNYVSKARSDFQLYLSRRDEKNLHVVQLQKNINTTVTDDLRFDDDVKCELHQRTRECVDKLHAILEKKESEASDVLTSIRGNKVLEEHVESMVKEITTMMQAETELFDRTRHLLIDASSKILNIPCTVESDGSGDAQVASIPTMTDAFGGSIETVEEDPKGKGKGKEAPVEDEGSPNPYSILDRNITVAQEFVTTCQEQELGRRLAVKKTHEEAFLQQLAQYDEEVSGGSGGKKGKGGGTAPPEFKPDEEMEYNDDLSKSLGWLEKVYLNRMKRLVHICKREGKSIMDYGESVYDSFARMIQYRLRDEYRCVDAFNNLCRETIEKEIKFEHLYTMDNTSNSIIDRLVQADDLTNTYGILDSPIQMYHTGAKGHEFKVDANNRHYLKPRPAAEPTVEAYADDKFSTTQESMLEAAFNDAYSALDGHGMRKEEVIDLVTRLGNEGHLPLKWSSKSVLELNDFIDQFEDKQTLFIRLDDMLDHLLSRPSRPNSSAV